jgi:hypothetical protein
VNGTIACAALIATLSSGGIAAAQNAAAADQKLMKALHDSDKTTVAALLDNDVLWTTTDGQTLDKAQVLSALPAPLEADQGPVSFQYGEVVTIRSQAGTVHVLRVWAERPDGWRLLVNHAVKQADREAPPSTAAPLKECINPCRTVPYQPKNAAETGVIKSWQALETAVSVGDAEAWAPHFADEFVVIRSGGTAPVTKQDRIAQLREQKQKGTAGAPGQLAPDHTRMFTIGGTVVMNCNTLPRAGKPSHVTRVWVKRGDMWVMTVSFQTTIQAASPVSGGAQQGAR